MGLGKSKGQAPVITEPEFDTPARLEGQIDLAYRTAHDTVSQFVVARDTLLEQADHADEVASRARGLALEYGLVAENAEEDATQFRRQAEKIADALGLSAHPAYVGDLSHTDTVVEDGDEPDPANEWPLYVADK